MNRGALKAAAAWHAQLCSGDASEADYSAWRAWLAVHPDHAWAWQQVETLQSRFRAIPGRLSSATLQRAEGGADATRRRMLSGLGLVLLGVTGGWLIQRQMPWQVWLAEHQTAVGERREVRLADGSMLMLNTHSAVDVVFDARQRLVRLHAGEVLVQTAAHAAVRPAGGWPPFIVETAHGRVRALGTRFTVRYFPEAAEVAVMQHAVEITPVGSTAHSRMVRAGELARFSDQGVSAIQPYDTSAAAWIDGLLVVNDWRLDQLVAELARYHDGTLYCEPAAAGLRISGAFPVTDVRAAFTAVARALPVQVVLQSPQRIGLVMR